MSSAYPASQSGSISPSAGATSGVADSRQFYQSPYAHGAVDPHSAQTYPPYPVGWVESQHWASGTGYGAGPSAAMSMETQTTHYYGTNGYNGATDPMNGIR